MLLAKERVRYLPKIRTCCRECSRDKASCQELAPQTPSPPEDDQRQIYNTHTLSLTARLLQKRERARLLHLGRKANRLLWRTRAVKFPLHTNRIQARGRMLRQTRCLDKNFQKQQVNRNKSSKSLWSLWSLCPRNIHSRADNPK